MFYLRRAFRFPESLEKNLAQALWQKDFPSEVEIERVAKHLRSLWPKLAEDLGTKSAEEDAHYSESQDFARAYSAYYLAAYAPKLPLILEEAHLLGLDILGEDCNWLDFGSGPGTALWGLSWWSKFHTKKFRFTGLEQSKHFVAEAQKLAYRLREFHANHTANFERFDGTHLKNILKEIRIRKPTVVSFLHSLHEFFPSEEQKSKAGKAILACLKELSATDGKARWLCIIEPGARINSRELSASLRLWQDEVEQAKLWLPCLNERPCGALMNPKDWCHEGVECEFPEWVQAIGHYAGLKKESVLFSYALLSVGKVRNPGAGVGSGADAGTADGTGTGREAGTRVAAVALAGAWPSNALRQVSQRLEQKGQTECYFCTADKGKIRARVQHSKVTEENKIFQEFVRGELLEKLTLGEKGDVLEIQKVAVGSAGSTLEKLFEEIFPS